MTWDATVPTTGTEIVDIPNVHGANWDALDSMLTCGHNPMVSMSAGNHTPGLIPAMYKGTTVEIEAVSSPQIGSLAWDETLGIAKVLSGVSDQWLTDWTSRKQVTLSRTSGAVTNYQMKILVGESAGAVGEDVDCGGKCLPTFNDIRFTTSDGETLLDYWIESITGTTPNQLATIWVEFNSIGTTATPFYMYYDNPGATAVSNGVNTFIAFDNFEWGVDGDVIGTAIGDPTLNTWKTAATPTRISTDQAYDGTRSAKMNGSTDMKTLVSLTDNIAVAFRFWKNETAGVLYTHGNGTKGFQIRDRDDEIVDYYSGTGYVIVAGSTPTTGMWHQFEVANIVMGTSMDLWLDDVKIVNDGAVNWDYSTTTNWLFLSQAVGITYIDDVRVRNYRATEPAWGAWGGEEIGGWWVWGDVCKTTSIQACISASNFIHAGVLPIPFDSIIYDVLSEWSSAGYFTPRESGFFKIDASVTVRLTSGDYVSTMDANPSRLSLYVGATAVRHVIANFPTEISNIIEEDGTSTIFSTPTFEVGMQLSDVVFVAAGQSAGLEWQTGNAYCYGTLGGQDDADIMKSTITIHRVV